MVECLELICRKRKIEKDNISTKTSQTPVALFFAQKEEPKIEVKINKEIRDYTESMFFGLSIRQFIFSVMAVIIAVCLYFGLRDTLGTEMVSWVCILGAAPCAALGFVKYNGMTAEQLVIAWLKSEVLLSKRLLFRPVNIYHEILKPGIAQREREGMKLDKNTQTD